MIDVGHYPDLNEEIKNIIPMHALIFPVIIADQTYFCLPSRESIYMKLKCPAGSVNSL